MAYKYITIPVDYLHTRLAYDPKTGVLRWKHRPRDHFEIERIWKRWNTAFSDKIAGTIHYNGYMEVRIEGRNYAAHRIAWAMTHDAWSQHEIDHINGNRSDNRISNLRQATHSENQHNRRISSNCTSGLKGVVFHKRVGKYQVKVNQKYFGYFDTAELAYAAACAAREALHGSFVNHG